MKEKEKKAYIKPKVQVNKAIARISGSGGSKSCGLYQSRVSGGNYWH